MCQEKKREKNEKKKIVESISNCLSIERYLNARRNGIFFFRLMINGLKDINN